MYVMAKKRLGLEAFLSQKGLFDMSIRMLWLRKGGNWRLFLASEVIVPLLSSEN
jgi:hypothetical protein